MKRVFLLYISRSDEDHFVTLPSTLLLVYHPLVTSSVSLQVVTWVSTC